MKPEQHIEYLRVDKKIISLLSKSTYIKNFANAIREMVSNAYDADALSVNISIDKNLNRIFIEDDGNGMSYDEFKYFCTIAGQKRNINFSRKFKRKRIGQFGIGFLSVFPFCEKLEIISTVENSNEILKATIPTEKYFIDDNTIDIQDIGFPVEITYNDSIKAQHYTLLNLINPTYHLKQYFSKDVTKKRATIRNYEPFDKFEWELEEDLPISYKPDSKFNVILKYEEPIGIKVFLNNKPLYRHEPCFNILSTNAGKVEDIKYKILISTNYESIHPQEFRGIKLRINNVGISERTDFGLKRDRGFSRLHWLNGEIMLSDNIKKYLSINRDSLLNESIVKDLYEVVSELLKKQAYDVETIAEAENEINETFKPYKTISNVKSKKDIIESKLNILKEKGFKIEKANDETKKIAQEIGNDILPPIKINKSNKIITIFNDADFDKDEETILNRTFNIVYKKWEIKKNNAPVILNNNNEIEINEDYPLFKSRQYGNLFKKIHILLLISKTSTISSEEMYNSIINNFLDEFKYFQT